MAARISTRADIELISRAGENVTRPNRFFIFFSKHPSSRLHLQDSPGFVTLDLLRGTKFIS